MIMKMSWLAAPMKLLPQPATAVGLGVTLNLFFTRYPDLKRRLSELAGKVFEFTVEDLGQSYYMRVEDDGRVRIHTYSDEAPNVTMNGDAEAFLQLLFNTEDPDSLFFARKLKMSGETETGLHFKNILDNVEIDWSQELGSLFGAPGAQLAAKMAAWSAEKANAGKQSFENGMEEWLDIREAPRANELDKLSSGAEGLKEPMEALARRISRLENRLKVRQAGSASS
ncbi:ubiquinone anaerobic biosynthesis accessory factor UbiT [Magnetofaba australis]|uniref:Putative lipid carrier protein-like protein n=1 Tax=Magnetofaba australis IT-1 TaxID=1434232 RepID=A0A1Y2K0E4_9PROT|nr:SCP2 sterol-binding domain-containing protein [Magnetofaba australis]OSM01498.1 putative lipid carrier protein-like protein [Magnetofaba australis IT-1]